MKEEETNFMDSIEKINFSVKTKDKSQFLHHLSNVYGYLLKENTNIKEDGNLETRENRADTKSTRHETKKTSGKLTRSITFSNLESLDIDFDVIKSLDNNSFSNECTSSNSFNSILINPLFKCNLNIVDDVMKLIVIGEEKVGKTLFINRFFDEGNTEGNFNNNINCNSYSQPSIEYTHTKSLEIKKKIVKLFGKNIRLEMWDTNTEIMANEISKGINIYSNNPSIFQNLRWFFLDCRSY